MKDFVFDKETHTGIFKGVVIPSITQLVELRYPMGNVKKEVLDNACERGTKVHEDIDNYCLGFVGSCGTKEGKNWVNLMTTFGLEVVKSEFELYFKDDDNNIIAYGHADQLLKATKWVYIDKLGNLRIEDETQFEGGETIILSKGALVLNDNKTVSQFDNNKVELQENLYSVMEDDDGELKVDYIIGTWVRDDKAQIRPLNKWNNNYSIETMVQLINEWREQHGTNN